MLTRNPIITLNGRQVQLIGDPHLGRKFDTNTPLERRGEREKSQFDKFKDLITNTPADYIIIMGDLFDKMKVSNEVLIATADILCQQTGKKIWVMRGNHDDSKDATLVSSFSILKALCYRNENVSCVEGVEYVTELGCYIFGYNAFMSTKELLLEVSPETVKVSAVFTHNDLDSFGGTDFNLMPYEELSKWTDTVYNGHVHKPCERIHNNLTVYSVGSMEPYAHGEQLDGEMYVSLTLEEYLKSPEGHQDKCLRILLKPGEKMPEGINALNISSKLTTDKEDDPEVEVKFEDFDFQQLFITTLRDAGVYDSTISEMWSKYEELRNVE